LIDSKIEKDVRYYLVKWVGYPKSANTWEPEINLRNSTDLIAEFDDAYPNKP
jgi:[histone H3]-lysine9 N-trimethyltransferase SUV39H